MDKADREILRNLIVDARLSSRQLAKRLEMGTTTVISRTKKMEGEGIIRGYTARIDHEKIGYALTAIIGVRARNGKTAQIEGRIAKFDNVCGVYDVTGSMDMVIIAKFKTRGELSKFVKALGAMPNVGGTETHLVLNTIKEDYRMT